jgi:hypothetical protein
LSVASSRYGTALTASKEWLWPVPKLVNDILWLPPTFVAADGCFAAFFSSE